MVWPYCMALFQCFGRKRPYVLATLYQRALTINCFALSCLQTLNVLPHFTKHLHELFWNLSCLQLLQTVVMGNIRFWLVWTGGGEWRIFLRACNLVRTSGLATNTCKMQHLVNVLSIALLVEYTQAPRTLR